MRRALIVWGGWDGHRPREMAAGVEALLCDRGYDVVVTPDLAVLGGPDIENVDLVVPLVTNAVIDTPVIRRLVAAVRGGTGLGGPHLAATAFRSAVDYHFMLGAQWVAHPGGIVDFRVDVTRPDDPIMRGIASFPYRSEQYYLHYDPSIEVLATTTFSGAHDPVVAGITMPVVFKRRFGAGRVFYSALGHSPEELEHPQARTILERGLLWATRQAR
ncbi:MAG: ThuA domain-containing protein [Devosia sp.]